MFKGLVNIKESKVSYTSYVKIDDVEWASEQMYKICSYDNERTSAVTIEVGPYNSFKMKVVARYSKLDPNAFQRFWYKKVKKIFVSTLAETIRFKNGLD